MPAFPPKAAWELNTYAKAEIGRILDLRVRLMAANQQREVAHSQHLVADEAGVYQSLDNMVARITAYGDSIGDQAGWVFGAVLGAIFFVLSALFAAITAGIIAFAKIVFALMIVIAPFMIITSLFKPTQSLFEAWSRATIGYALMPVAAAGAAGIIVAIAEAIADAFVDPGDVETVSLILPFLVILLLSARIMASPVW